MSAASAKKGWLTRKKRAIERAARRRQFAPIISSLIDLVEAKTRPEYRHRAQRDLAEALNRAGGEMLLDLRTRELGRALCEMSHQLPNEAMRRSFERCRP